MPIGHSVNANIAMVSAFSIHHDRAEAIRRGQEGFEFFGYAINALVAHDAVPGRSTLWGDFQKQRGNRDRRDHRRRREPARRNAPASARPTTCARTSAASRRPASTR